MLKKSKTLIISTATVIILIMMFQSCDSLIQHIKSKDGNEPGSSEKAVSINHLNIILDSAFKMILKRIPYSKERDEYHTFLTNNSSSELLLKTLEENEPLQSLSADQIFSTFFNRKSSKLERSMWNEKNNNRENTLR